MIRRILMVPGFCEPPWLLEPIRRALRRPGRPVDLWHDRLVFRNLERSVHRLRGELQSDVDAPRTLGILTHSFGDWIVRQAIAETPQHNVAALVSVAPVLGPSPFATVLQSCGGSFISEIPTMADPLVSAENARLDGTIPRFVLWASIDPWVRAADLSDFQNTEVQSVWATHLSIVLQPNVHALVRDFFNRFDADPPTD